ncbi:MAG: ferritin-like domain-containing protein [Chlamydiae bacterium]|nr:ferritin-like domain-containing protein [Chlamydiota bacterium]
MEIKDWAIRILSGDTLEEKLLCPDSLEDHEPGHAVFWKEPARPLGMQFCKFSKKDKLPPFVEHEKEEKRAICLHRFAGHELLAVEMMAYVLLAFPEAPKHFRKGVANTLMEEQTHVKLYANRLKELGIELSSLPFFRNFWSYIPHVTSPLRYISLMSLTFEMANLDFAPLYGESFAKVGDEKSAALMGKILHDELKHVSFGWNWLKKFKPENQTEWQTWTSSLPEKITPRRAAGPVFFAENRKKAGLPEEWIRRLAL